MQSGWQCQFVNQVLQDPDHDKDTKYLSYDCLYTSDILVLKLISVLVFILFSSQNFYFI